MNRKIVLTFMAIFMLTLLSNVPLAAADGSAWYINTGGGDVTDNNGNLFVADKTYVAGDFGYTGNTRSFTFSGDVANTTEDALYLDMRSGNSFSYLFDIPDGEYDVTLYFMEPWQSAAGERIFDVSIEGSLVLDDYDVFVAAGGQFTAVNETFTTTISDGQLNIDFMRGNRVALIQAIAVVSTDPGVPEPDISVSPTSLDFGDVEIGMSSDLTVSVTNDGTADLNVSTLSTSNPVFTVESPTAPLVITPGNSEIVTVRFSPTAAGAQAGTLDIASDDADEPTVSVSLSGNGTTPPPNEPDIDVNPTSVDFGNVATGGSDDQMITVENVGLQDLTISDITSSNSVFIISGVSTPLTLNPGGSVDVTITFNPTVDGVESGDLDILSDDPDEPTVTVSLTGTGTSTPAAAYRINAGGGDYTDGNGNLFVADKAYAAGDFGYSGNIRSFTFGNAIDGTDDDLLYQSVNINVSLTYLFDLDNGSYDVTLHFMEPFQNAAGERLIDITVEDTLLYDNYDIYAMAGGKFTAVTESFTVEVTDGQLNIRIARDTRSALISAIEVVSEGGITPPTDQDISLSTTSLNFGQVTIGGSNDQVVTVDNVGGMDLTVNSMSTSDGVFTIESPSTPFTLTPGGSQDVTVRFTPTTETNETGDLTINSDDPDESVVTVALSGDGVPTSSGNTYSDVTAQVGITAVDTLPTNGCGVPAGNGIAWADFDNDGDVDAYVTHHGGANWLYRNDGDINSDNLPDFTNVAAAAGVELTAEISMSAVFIDYDNDGDQDLYVTNDGGNTLFENNGNSTFTDITASAGVADTGRAVTSAWADFNGDSYLDFYVAKHQPCTDDNDDRLYMSNGDGTFAEVTSYLCSGSASCAQVEGLGFSPGWLDYDNDGDVDLYLVNDDIGGVNYPNVLWRNDGSDGSGGWLFTDVSVASGTDASLNGMGQGIGDYNNDGWLDLAFSNGAPGRLLENNGDGTFTDVSASSNVTTIVTEVTWGTVFFDYDNDGDQDLYYVAGAVNAQSTDIRNFLLENNGNETFTDVSAASGLDDPGRGRSASIVDIDGDGFVDVMVGNYGGTYALYHNDGSSQGNNNHYLTITVEGTDSNRDGIGTRISVTAGGVTQIREINSGPTHGGGDYRAGFFGLGANTTATVEVSWPNGQVENLGSVSADQLLHLVEPSAVSEPDIDVVSTADFGDAETGTSRDKLIDVTNSGSATLTISSMTTNNGVFTVETTTPLDIAAGATSKVTVRFSPSSDGVETADLTIVSNDPDEGSVVVALTGTGVTAASTTFVDVIGLAGIDPTHTLASICNPPIGAGSAWADFDNDGDIDVYITDHGAANNLYRNDGDGNSDGVPEFTDIAGSMGLTDAAGVGHATNWIDYDNDGDQDLYVSNWGSSHLYQNRLIEDGSVSFVDVTASAGLLDDGRTVTAAWADFDNDGHLDVYLAKHAYCGGSDPRNGDKLYHSNGDGTFTDVTASWFCAGCDPIDHALGFSAGWVDYDNDGDLDLYVVNDILQGDGSGGTENFHNALWRNDGSDGSGGWNFAEVSVAANADTAVNGMGLGMGDYDNDGDFDFAFSDVGASTLLSNDGDGTFTDVSFSSGAGTGALTWGTAFFDYDNDGWLDLFFASGLIGSGGSTPDIFLQNNQNGTFTDISVSSGLNNDGRGRHAAMVDFDLDGLVDLFVGNYGTPGALYQNRADAQGNTNNWLFVTVEGTDSNRDGIGTRLTLTAGGVTQIREITSGATHGGGDYRAAYFGLDTATSGTLTIEWPNGEVEVIAINSGDINQYRHQVEPVSTP